MTSIHDGLTALEKAKLDYYPPTHAFAVISWGCAATSWLAWALNAHPDIFCLHAGNDFWRTFGKAPPLDGAEYLRVVASLGYAHKAAGDVHGVSRDTIPNIRQVFGPNFSAAVVIREPIRRLLSQMALFDAFKGFRAWDIDYVDSMIKDLEIDVHPEDYHAKLFVHGANMLNAIGEEVRIGPVYRSEDLTTNEETLTDLAHHLSAGRAREIPTWAREAISMGKVNSHVSRRGHISLQGWQIASLKKCVSQESWEIYEHFGYGRPEFI